eukprot:SAG22_NODE_5095_length_1087_cov_1.579960_1_plen_103_part_10
MAYNTGGGDGAAATAAAATTLKGQLLAGLPAGRLGARLLADIMADEAEVFSWAARGPRLFARLQAADLVALQEYDIHGAVARYDGGGGGGGGAAEETTFPAAM